MKSATRQPAIRRLSSVTIIGTSCIVCATLGCATQLAQLRVTQPQFEGLQRDLKLHSEWAFFDGGGEETRRLLLAFPLPGAWAGTRHFLLYVRLPGTATMAKMDEASMASRSVGFFLQTKGEGAGLTELVSGSISVQGVAFGGQQWCQGRIEVVATDGTKLDGRFRARRTPFELRRFEQERYPGDVEALLDRSRNEEKPTDE